MSFRPRHALLLAFALGFIAVAFFGPGSRKKTSRSTTVETGFVSAPASAVASASLELLALPHLPFIFECQAVTPASVKPCAALPTEARELLGIADAYRMPPLLTLSPELAQRVESALGAASKLDAPTLAPLEKAALQNATLSLLARIRAYEKDKQSGKMTVSARVLLKKFALSRAEIAALPTSTAVVAEWLGDSADWRQGKDATSMHTASDGYARAHSQLQRTDAVADVVRMVLLSDTGAPYIPDIVQRIVMRRTTEDAVHVCIAELDPSSASCSTAGSVRALEPARGQSIVTPTSSAPCTTCHTNNSPKAVPFGPSTGFQLPDATAARIKLNAERALLQ